jgi:hypothetical protein
VRIAVAVLLVACGDDHYTERAGVRMERATAVGAYSLTISRPTTPRC